MNTSKSSFDLRQKIDANRALRNQNASAIQSQEPLRKAKPMLCKMCNRPSFLKCLDCDVIYCSAKCQVDDWEGHQYQHIKKNYLRLPPQTASSYSYTRSGPHESVSGRLKKAQETPPVKFDVDAQQKQMDQMLQKKEIALQPPVVPPRSNVKAAAVVDLTKLMSSVELREASRPMAQHSPISSSSPLISERKIIAIPKYKRHVKFDETCTDTNGFHLVCVTEVEDKIDSSVIFWVMPYEVMGAHEAYKKVLNDTYDRRDLPHITVEDIPAIKAANNLLMAKISGNWARVLITNFVSPIVAVEDIDTGAKSILNMEKDYVKKPLEQELMKSAFAFNTLFENLSDAGEVEVGDCLKIRVTHYNLYGHNLAEVCLEAEEEMDIREDAPICSAEKRYSRDDIHMVELKTGDKVSLSFWDGSKVEVGKLHVSENSKENTTFYEKLNADIAEYIKSKPDSGNYKPVACELVLAKFSDGIYYRAVCVNISDIDCKVSFIDYGCDYVCDIKDVVKLPAQFMQRCCSHTVDFKLSSGRPITAIDALATRRQFEEKYVFSAKVEVDSYNAGKYLITLDDSQVHLK